MAFTPWYKDMAVYHIWTRSFCDGNGDGIGDLWGVLKKLDVVQMMSLGLLLALPIDLLKRIKKCDAN